MILLVTRYQLMIWMVASGRLILPDGLSRCDRDWFAVTRYARRATSPVEAGAVRHELLMELLGPPGFCCDTISLEARFE